MNFFNFEPTAILTGALVFIRISALMFALPIFGDSTTPIRIRILLAVAVAFGLFPVIPQTWAPSFDLAMVEIFILIGKEILIGLIIGFSAKMFFEGVVMAAHFVGYQMGFGTSNLFIPDGGLQINGFTALHRNIVMLLFLTLGLHHVFLEAIVGTFQLIPAGEVTLRGDLATALIEMTAGIFVTAMKLGAPILIALLFTMAALGLIAKTVPQMNIFTMSFPISFFVGLLIYAATVPFFSKLAKDSLGRNQARCSTYFGNHFTLGRYG